jgi:hypothetical protein
MKKVRSYEKRHEDTIKVRSYDKVKKLRKGTKLKKGTKLRNKLRKALVTKLLSYQIVTPPIGKIYYDA